VGDDVADVLGLLLSLDATTDDRRELFLLRILSGPELLVAAKLCKDLAITLRVSCRFEASPS
jgi:hypothetical protein